MMLTADEGARCSEHRTIEARATCSRCGRFACEVCLTGDSREEPLCVECDARMATDSARPAQRVASITRIAALAYVVFSALMVGLVLTGVDQESLLFGFTALVQVSATLTFGLSFVVWQRRTNSALRARGMVLEYGPNAWGWFFAPVLNLWKPYQAVSELYTRATGEIVSSRFLPAWWGLWIVGNLAARAGSKWNETMGTADAVGLVALMGAAYALAEIVRRTTQELHKGRTSGLAVDHDQ